MQRAAREKGGPQPSFLSSTFLLWNSKLVLVLFWRIEFLKSAYSPIVIENLQHQNEPRGSEKPPFGTNYHLPPRPTLETEEVNKQVSSTLPMQINANQANRTPACRFFFAVAPMALFIPVAWLLSSELMASRFLSSSILLRCFSVFCLPLPLP